MTQQQNMLLLKNHFLLESTAKFYANVLRMYIKVMIIQSSYQCSEQVIRSMNNDKAHLDSSVETSHV